MDIARLTADAQHLDDDGGLAPRQDRRGRVGRDAPPRHERRHLGPGPPVGEDPVEHVTGLADAEAVHVGAVLREDSSEVTQRPARGVYPVSGADHRLVSLDHFLRASRPSEAKCE
ncbi:hypothetical protein [Roseovarius sp. M141]|uniref:hypothetical protein n=1 Tax=Roseovarius sp. M141 TaxID=2583806 RepID=UPI0020CDEEE0|nr:hypothetical protein [Roseovarius sp. M141]MCQ0091386.1 hypothetical protein [Roseovarius sp. M141]